MKNTFLYIATVILWGSSWISIKFQLEEVAIETALFHRFLLAAGLMLIFCVLFKLPMRFSLRNHGFIFLLSLLNFSFNYFVVYRALNYLSSGTASVAFTTMVLMNLLNVRIFFGKKIEPKSYAGAAMGIVGVGYLFWGDLSTLSLNSDTTIGLILTLIAAYIASLGNMISIRNSDAKLPVLQVNALCMAYGCLIIFLVTLISGHELFPTVSPTYISLSIYMSVFATVFGFAAYYVLLKSIGPEKASYAIVLFPVVAVSLGLFFDETDWSEPLAYGMGLTLLGNAVVLTNFSRIRELYSRIRYRQI